VYHVTRIAPRGAFVGLLLQQCGAKASTIWNLAVRISNHLGGISFSEWHYAWHWRSRANHQGAALL